MDKSPERSRLERFQNKTYNGEPYQCPICFCGLNTPEEKTAHLASVHNAVKRDVKIGR